MIDMKERKRIHFIGIGGISMSGLARIMLSQGNVVTGSDMIRSKITDDLSREGVKIYIGHNDSNVEGADLVVYTAAIKHDNPEYMGAKERNIRMMERSEFLGCIMKSYEYSINISGTHGKTTTTSMISSVVIEAGLEPTVHIGGELDKIGGSTLVGGSKYFITEACEYVGSFLKFYPYMALVLNIDADHLDYFSNIEDIKETFHKFISLVPKDGYIVGYLDDENVKDVLGRGVECKNIITYAVQDKRAKWMATDIQFDEEGFGSFELLCRGEHYCDVKLSVIGMHNVLNALAACSVCFELGIEEDVVVRALEEFRGAHRRFEYKGEKNDVRVVDDYAHHPSEIKATLKASKRGHFNKEWCVFQPHTYTRTKALLDEFSKAFSDADNVIITDIYAAREVDTGEINSNMLVERLQENNVNAMYIKSFDDIVDYLNKNVQKNDLILTMGAGDIYRVGEKYLDELQ